MKTIVYGATGFTGRLVCRALAARRLPFVAAGRDGARLAELSSALGGLAELRTASTTDQAGLNATLADADLIISCAGPFAQVGEPVVRAALAAGAHYLDTTGEQGFMREVYERYEAEARHRGLCVCSAFAFEVALGDWAAALAARELRSQGPSAAVGDLPGGSPLDEIAIGYAVRGFRATRGTQLSALAMAAEGGVVWDGRRWDQAILGADVRSFGFPAPFGPLSALSFPSGEIITVPRHADTRRVQTYLAAGGAATRALAPAARALAPFVGAALRSPLGDFVRRRVADAPDGPTDGQRKVTDFAVVAEARRDFDRAFCAVSGTDVYGVTAEIIAYGAHVLTTEGPAAAGVVAPAQAVEPAAALRALGERAGLQVSASFTW